MASLPALWLPATTHHASSKHVYRLPVKHAFLTCLLACLLDLPHLGPVQNLIPHACRQGLLQVYTTCGLFCTAQAQLETQLRQVRPWFWLQVSTMHHLSLPCMVMPSA